MKNLKELSIGIVGNGIVGGAIARSYLEWCKVFVHDKDPKRNVHSMESVLGCDMIFVCLPEPELDGFFRQAVPERNYAIKSTVEIGTTSYFREKYHLYNLVHSPEFLTERCAFLDAQIPSRNIIGGVPSDCKDLLRDIYQYRFAGTSLFLMNSSEESEAVKLFTNGFFSVKIAFFNEIEKLADSYGWNWHRILNAMLADGRITRSHTRVPGPDGLYGFGGRCLVKDLDYLIKALGIHNAPVSVAAKKYARRPPPDPNGTGMDRVIPEVEDPIETGQP